MSGPAQSLCPVCHERPRRRPGHRCTPCSADELRARRAGRVPPPLDPTYVRGPRQDDQRVPEYRQEITRQRVVVTCAQNATPVYRPLLAALLTYCRERDAQLVVVPIRYRNPTSVWGRGDEGDNWWAEELRPYLCSVRTRLHRHLVLAADVRVQPTAAYPLAGLEGLTGRESCVVGHPRMALRCVASVVDVLPKILTTTGAVTKPNTTDTKVGKLGEFHHCLGAVVIDRTGPRFHVRPLNADRRTGAFTDLDRVYSSDGAVDAPPALAVILGDVHGRALDPAVRRATFGAGGILEVLRPNTLVVHDALDAHSCNPHSSQDPFAAIARNRSGTADVGAEVRATVAMLAEWARDRNVVVTASNHDDMLRRWLVRADWKLDPQNASYYLRLAADVADTAHVDRGGVRYASPFALALRAHAPGVRALAPGESYQVAGIECGMHGHEGPNGSRGSVRNLSQLGTRTITGHGHSPAIEGGHYRCGTSSVLRLDYNTGPSSWLHAHVVIYADGKRAILPIVHGHWRSP